MAHTPTPWKAFPGMVAVSVTVRSADPKNPKPIAEIWHNGDEPHDNAAFIVRAVNAHDEMLAALKAAEEYMAARATDGSEPYPLAIVRAAIAKATGETAP